MNKKDFKDYMLFRLIDLDLSYFKYLAVDEGGQIWLYINKPTIDEDYWYENLMDYDKDSFFNSCIDSIRLNLNELGIDWKDTLVKL